MQVADHKAVLPTIERLVRSLDIVNLRLRRFEMTNLERATVCVHEAGHAIISAALGLGVDWVSIDLEGAKGMCRRLTRGSDEQAISVSLAGGLAVDAFINDGSGADPRFLKGDQDNIRTALVKAGRPAAGPVFQDRLVQEAMGKTSLSLLRYRSSVTVVALLLDEFQTIGGSSVDAVMEMCGAARQGA